METAEAVAELVHQTGEAVFEVLQEGIQQEEPVFFIKNAAVRRTLLGILYVSILKAGKKSSDYRNRGS
jgi:hypothetical protein